MPQYSTDASATISIASESEAEEAARLRDTDKHRISVYRSRIRRGHKCFVAKVEGVIIGCNWLIFRAEVDDADFTVVGPGEVMCSDAYTAPEWRGKGVHTALLASMLEWAGNAGFRMAYTELPALHRASWITHHRLGWEIALVVLKIRAGKNKRDQIWSLGSSSQPLRGQFW